MSEGRQKLLDLLADEERRQAEFPIARSKTFLAHGGVTAVPRCVTDAMNQYNEEACSVYRSFGDVLIELNAARKSAAQIIGAKSQEIALLGPTSLGLSMFAQGLTWEPGDEVVCYGADYPANYYPWKDLEHRFGVKPVLLEPEFPGLITPELVESALTDRTKLVALASANFLSGYRIDHNAIGKLLHDRGILFSLDAIQTIGATETTVEHVDFLSADAHKWMLGPLVMGIVYVAEEHFERLRPTLLGAWNVQSPNFVTQKEIVFEAGARRYEPGVLNASAAYGMKVGLDMLMDYGIDVISERLMELKAYLIEKLEAKGYQLFGPRPGPDASGITTFTHPDKDLSGLEKELWENKNIILSVRYDASNKGYLRFSPHFYNTFEELDRAIAEL